MAVKQLSDGGPDGTKLGQDASDLVGLHGATPSDQYAAVADISVTGTYATDDTPIETAINGILAALREKGIIASS
jgi:hypothetical protein